MAERRETNPLLSGPLLLAVAAVASGLILSQTAIRSSRPGSKPEHERTSAGDQTIDARLWQDPFEAIHSKVLERVKESKESNTPARLEKSSRFSVTEMAQQIERHFREPPSMPNATNILILQVMISGGRYIEDAESRRRSRYAVLSALSVAGYVPWDAEHIGFFEVPWPRGRTFETGTNCVVASLTELADSTESEDPLPVPFEWFQQNELQPIRLAKNHEAPLHRIVVWWLNADVFEDHPLKRLAQVIEHLKRSITNQPAAFSSLQFKLIDPSLKAFLSEQPTNSATVFLSTLSPSGDLNTIVPIANLLSRVEVYSSWSTTADALLWERATDRRRENVAAKLKEWGLQFYNTTCTDDELASKLVSELELRGVHLANTNHSVALISEWDTFYGRALPLTFAAELIRRANPNELGDFNKALLALKDGTANWPSNIYRFTYMRGIDGLLPGETPLKPEAGKEKTKAKEIEDLERPAGQSQLDYMPRLALELKEREREGLEHNHKPLRAIGVLGSDVYDKLLVLQSLHKLYPGAIFFTTDLDARLLHPAELSWSRNLIVASSFDLELGEELQQDIPPFRDTYQTGKFLACLAALGRVGTNDLESIQPRIFEVGRNGAYTLNIVEDNSSEAKLYSSRPGALTRSVGVGWRILTLLLALLLVGSFSRKAIKAIQFLRPTDEPGRKKRRLCVRSALAVLGIGMGLWLLIYYEHYINGNGEPFSLSDGVSLWPSEIIRLAGAGLSVIFLLMTAFALKESDTDLAVEFQLVPSDETQLPKLQPLRETGRKPEGIWKRFYARVKAWWEQWSAANLHLWEWKESKVSAAALWEKYLWLGTKQNRLWRIVPAVVLYFGLGFLLAVKIDEPFRPFRGAGSDWVDRGVLGLSTLALVFLMFSVVDTALLCRKFIENLSTKPTQWPEDLLHDQAKARNMAPGHLDEWLDIQLIAKRTKVVGNFIYYPFIVLFLMIAARSSYFDHFDWPLSLVLIFGINSAFAFYCAVALRQATEKARHNELQRLEEKLVKARGGGDEQAAATIQLTIDQIRAVDEGAFAPWSSQPFIRAILVPFGGTGIITLIQYLFST